MKAKAAAQAAAQAEQDGGDPAMAQPEVVDGGSDQGRQQGERHHVDDEVQQDLLT